MLQAASLGGVYAVRFVAPLIAATPARIGPADERGLVPRLLPLFLALGVVAAQVGYGNWRLASTPLEERDDLRARLVQPMILEHRGFANIDHDLLMSRLISLTETRLPPSDPGIEGVTHVIWPESVFPFFLSEYRGAGPYRPHAAAEYHPRHRGAARAARPDGTPDPGSPLTPSSPSIPTAR